MPTSVKHFFFFCSISIWTCCSCKYTTKTKKKKRIRRTNDRAQHIHHRTPNLRKKTKEKNSRSIEFYREAFDDSIGGNTVDYCFWLNRVWTVIFLNNSHRHLNSQHNKGTLTRNSAPCSWVKKKKKERISCSVNCSKSEENLRKEIEWWMNSFHRMPHRPHCIRHRRENVRVIRIWRRLRPLQQQQLQQPHIKQRINR